MARINWSPPPPPPQKLPARTWRRLPEVDVWTDDDGTYLVTGTPQPADDHSCDEMGCTSHGPHVLVRLRRTA